MNPKTIKNELVYKILKITGMGVLFVVVSFLAPIFPYIMLRMYIKKKFGKNYSPVEIRNAVKYIKRKQFIAYKNKKVILTKKGLKYLQHKAMFEICIKPSAWDNKWRLVIFDISQKDVSARHLMRRRLKDLGFYHFQKSVFIIPYNCEEEIMQLASLLGVEECVHVLITERFSNDKDLITNFKLGRVRF